MQTRKSRNGRTNLISRVTKWIDGDFGFISYIPSLNNLNVCYFSQKIQLPKFFFKIVGNDNDFLHFDKTYNKQYIVYIYEYPFSVASRYFLVCLLYI